ncbi:hypothetical protein CSKR_113324 [Clonorchis sinensis]|uniref:Uncharacterized protein n=1 Tax=Clonorchis sinensis TaxID=79923 RepID=A0A3R7F179_CLOSI|nr:hypothetical protein CSKR_113324 [Clonorchis sinensis]
MEYDKYTHLQINLVFTGDSNESLVYDIHQLNVLHKDRLMFQLKFRQILPFEFNLVFVGDSAESLVYGILQLSVLHKGRPMFQLMRYWRYRSIFLV